MVAVAPDTDIILLQVPLQLNQEHQLNFANPVAQFNYFNSLPKMTIMADSTFQRSDNIIRYEGNYEDLIGYNYLMYRNKHYSNRWFYCFVERIEYINDRVTNIYIKTDVWQTWQFTLVWKNTFVEREHASNDAIGSNVVPENIEIGDYVYNGAEISLNQGGQSGYLLAVQCTTLTSTLELPSGSQPSVYGNMFQGLPVFAISTSDNGYRNLKLIKKHLADNGIEDGITAIFYVSGDMFDVEREVTIDGTKFYVYYPSTSSFAKKLDEKQLTRPTSINSYQPRNNKLFTYPYTYLFATNHNGGEAEYRYEDFSNVNQPSFELYGTVAQGNPCKMLPKNYKGLVSAYDYGIQGSKLPICSWATDYYLNYIAQNGFSMASNVASGLLGGIASVAGGFFTGTAGVGGIASVFNSITNVMGEVDRASKTPNQANGDTTAGDINFSLGEVNITVRAMSIKAQYARQVDDYFSKFGYATRRVKNPNITGRRNWNYVKTIGCFIQSNAPQEDMRELEAMFDNGITFWHNPETFMDYSQANPIV